METASQPELVINLGAVAANVETLMRRCPGAAVMVVVKADGYGHGMLPVARAARGAGAPWLGVATVREALALRADGDSGRILCWLTLPREDLTPVLQAGIDVTAYSAAEVRTVAEAARRIGTVAKVQLKVDTGLSRGGATLAHWPEVVSAARSAQEAGLIHVSGVWSHLACADEPAHPANDLQESRFRSALLHAADLAPETTHLSNSAAALTRPSARFDVVRCGIAVYGLTPAPAVASAAEFGLRPAMSAQASVALAKQVDAGESVSYGHTYTLQSNATVALVPVGYGDGVPVAASGKAEVLIGGARLPISGRVCMDQFVVDVGDLEVATGAPVLLFGPGDQGEPTVDDWARACDTINYEIVTRLGGRFRRTYVHGDKGRP